MKIGYVVQIRLLSAAVALVTGPAIADDGGSPIGRTVDARGVGATTCVTALMPDNRVAAENWIAGFWAAWDMSQITTAEPLAPNSDLNGIVGEVEKVCREKPSISLLFATLEARSIVKTREEAGV
ncbi:hypothetical protein [Altererythrobacter sp. C41]|uniref:hypothetical protein n=1 Tax=Altererythrobacter sp. C41 TaxID=2806021 RepID=UPI001934A5CB|nr:hypothetical protein [Altererythrobacter sp. C41]MBM0169663.1 hypothetical protein [Altererythrobacter sp. C41]